MLYRILNMERNFLSEHKKTLYNRRTKKIDKDLGGPAILRKEVDEAVRKMKWGKNEGSDGYMVEMMEAAGDNAKTNIKGLANNIYESGDISEIMKEAELIVIPKKRRCYALRDAYNHQHH